MDFDSIVLPSHANPIVITWLKQGKLKIDESGCWLWQLGKNKARYGLIWIDGRDHYTHRVAINAEKGLMALHGCRNRHCCNPSHLRQGTATDNGQDMKKDRTGLRIGARPRCDCGKAVDKDAVDCHECMSVRLNKPKCLLCDERSRHVGLCNRHYQSTRTASKRASISSLLPTATALQQPHQSV